MQRCCLAGILEMPEDTYVPLVHHERRLGQHHGLPHIQLALLASVPAARGFDHAKVPDDDVNVGAELVLHAEAVWVRPRVPHGHVAHIEGHERCLEYRPQRVASDDRIRLIEVIAMASDVRHPANRDNERLAGNERAEQPLDEDRAAIRVEPLRVHERRRAFQAVQLRNFLLHLGYHGLDLSQLRRAQRLKSNRVQKKLFCMGLRSFHWLRFFQRFQRLRFFKWLQRRRFVERLRLFRRLPEDRGLCLVGIRQRQV
mmetsp:Transcript_57560/g.160274  ORF Transcript_57560/g.160274 Transcript_57560/m.160274 type:complete len:256 (+) Transcript_57560:819-1586(+)